VRRAVAAKANSSRAPTSKISAVAAGAGLSNWQSYYVENAID